MSTNLEITSGPTNQWTLAISSGSGPVLMSARGGPIEWVSGSSLPAATVMGHLLLADDVPEDSKDGPETQYFSMPLITNIYTRPLNGSAVVVLTTNAELFGGQS